MVLVCVWKFIEQVWGVQLTGTGLCLELITEGVGSAVFCTGLCLYMNRAGVWRSVNWY